MKVRILAEVGAQLKAFPPPLSGLGPRVGCGVDRTSSRPLSVFLGICSDSPRLEPVLPPFLSGQPGLARGAGPLVLVGGRGAPCIHAKGICVPHPRSASQPALLLAPFSCKRRRYPAAGATRPPPRAGLLCSALCQRAGLLEPWALTSAHPGPYPGRPCCMVMGCQGDIHLFLWAWAAAARAQARMAMAGGSDGRAGERTREHPSGAPPPRLGLKLPAPPWGPCQPGIEGTGWA